MAVTYATFLVRFKEFEKADQPLIEAEIALVTQQVNAQVWGEQTDDAIGLLVAHRIAKRPAGQFARLVNKSGSTFYLEEYERMRDEILDGDRVV